MEISLNIIWMAAGIYLLAGVLKGTLGIGFPTAVIAMMALFVDARTAILLAIVPMIATNLWQVLRSGQVLETFKEIWPLVITMVVFIVIFTKTSASFPHELLLLCVGVAVAIFAITSLWLDPPALSPKYKLPAQISTGLVAGVMGGLASIWAPAIIVYLSATRVDKEEFVSTVGLLLLIGSITLFATYWNTSMITMELTRISAMLVIPSIVGFSVGEKLRKRVSNELFRKLMLWFFLLMGLNLLWRAIGNMSGTGVA